MTKHTPGPWTIKVHGFFNRGMALYSQTMTSKKMRLEAEANARLIAAAPEMLAALKAAQFAFGFGSSATMQQQREAAEAITAAIITATGEV